MSVALPVLLSACHKCPMRSAAVAGVMTCTVDGQNVIDHAKAGQCPQNRYPQPKPAKAKRISPKLTTPAATAKPAKPCNCGASLRERQEKLLADMRERAAKRTD